MVGEETFRKLERTGSRKSNLNPKSMPRVYAYGQLEQLQIIGEVTVEIAHSKKPEKKILATFYCVHGANEDLLGWKTATKIRCLRIGLINNERVMRIKYKEGLTKEDENSKPYPSFPSFELNLEVDNSIPPSMRNYYIIPPELEEKVKIELQNMLNSDIIEKAEFGTSWISPLIAVEKPNGDVRVCVDLTKVNEAIADRKRYRMPTTDEMKRFASGKKFMAKLDLRKAFYHIKLGKELKSLLTFKSPWGYFTYKRMPFGLSAAPEVFQSIIDQIVTGIPQVKAYMDDIIAVADTIGELEEIFDLLKQKLHEHNFEINADKTEFGVEKLEFVGFILSVDGIEVPPQRTEAIVSMAPPKDLKELKSFMGKVNFLNSHIPNLTAVAIPLWDCLRKEEFRWTCVEQETFEKVKILIVENVKLNHFNLNFKTYLVTDAGPDALAAVLFQVNDQTMESKVISYWSRLLNKTQKKYPHFQKELLAMVQAVEHFAFYLRQTPFEILTDLRTAECILDKSLNHSKVEHKRHDAWLLTLQGYQYKIRRLPGKLNIADPLSRMTTVTIVNDGEEIIDQTHEGYCTKNEGWENQEYRKHYDKCYVCHIATKSHMSISCNNVLEALKDDKELMDIMSKLAAGKEEEIEKKWKTGFFPLYIHESKLVMKGHRVILPKNLRFQAYQIAHKTHLGAEGTTELLKQYVWWPGISADVKRLVLDCEICQQLRGKGVAEPMRSTPLPSGPWEHISIDLFTAPEINAKVFVCIDNYSRFTVAEPVKDGTAKTIIQHLEKIFFEKGFVKLIRADHGPPMESAELTLWCQERGIELEYSTPYHPEGNGLVERAMQRIKFVLIYSKLSGQNWQEVLRRHCIYYNNVPHSTTKVAPFVAMNSRRHAMGLPLVYSKTNFNESEMRANDEAGKMKSKIYQDNYVGATPSSLEIDDIVWVLNETKTTKLTPDYGPHKYRIREKNGSKLTLQRIPSGEIIERDVKKVVKCPPSTYQKLEEEILQSIVSRDGLQRTNVNDIPISLFPQDLQTITDLELGETVEAEISKQAANDVNELRRPRRACRDKSDKILKDLHNKVRFITCIYD